MNKNHWLKTFNDWLKRSASSVDDLVDLNIRRLRRRIGREGVPQIQPYRGYASAEKVWLHGRILTNPPIDPNFKNDRWWDNLTNAVTRFASNEVPDVEVEATIGGVSERAISDAEGYFHIAMENQINDGCFWTNANMRIVDDSDVNRQADPVISKVLHVPSDARLAIISDVDDTILRTGATDIATMAKLTFFGNARTRAPLDGVAQLYRCLQRDAQNDNLTNPIFYISSSPWNLYDLLEDFLRLNDIPLGPLLLRDLGFDDEKFIKSGHGHKLTKARRLIRTFPHLPFLLFGDSGQEDARLYAEAAREYPDRIQGIFIRDIDPELDSEHDQKVDRYVREAAEVGVPMYLVRDSIQAATIAIDHGWLSPDDLPDISAATLHDKERDSGAMTP